MKVFVTGGTGLIGVHLIPQLIENKYEVYILSRDPKKVERKFGNSVHGVIGNPTEKGEWIDQLLNMDIIINLVGENILRKRWSNKQKSKLYDSRVLSKNNILNALSQFQSSNPDKQYTLISPSGVDYYPTSKDREFDESDLPVDNFISNLCRDWEVDTSNLKNVRAIVFRFGVVFTKTGKGAELMFLPHKFFIGSWLGNGKQHFSFIHIDDLTGVILWAISNKEVTGTFNAVSPETLSLKETAKIGGRIIGRWTWLFMPGFVLRLVLGKRSDLLLKGRKVSSKKIQDAGYKFLYPTVEMALTDILGKKK